MMKLNRQYLLPATVLPPVLGAVLAYPAMFFDTLYAKSQERGVERHGRTLSSGPLVGAFRYDITQRPFSRSYRVVVAPASAAPGEGVCAVEVRGGPMPTAAYVRPGGYVRVAFEQPLLGYATRALEVNLAAALDNPCAATIANGVVLAPTGLPQSVAALASPVGG